MTNGLNEVIEQLEQQRTAIERALSALREVGGVGRSAAPSTGHAGPAKRKGGMTAEGRRRLSEALKKRWAAKRASSHVRAKAKRKSGGMTPEGRKRLSEALKKRWAVKRAAKSAHVKRAGA